MNRYRKDNRKQRSTDESSQLSDSQRKKLKLIRRISVTVDYAVLVVSVLLLILGLYAFYDTHKVYQLADADELAQYKPSSQDRTSYEKLRKMNPDVIGWLDVYGTNIDYPVLQGKDNQRYLDETVTGEYSTAGSIFLDYRNDKEFRDFNSILYGHHMDQGKMFGDVDRFANKAFFHNHAYAVLHRNDKPSLGVEFFAIIKTEGSDVRIFTPALSEDRVRKKLIDYLYDNAIQSREMEIDEDDRILMLNTCTFSITNGRYILAGKLTDKVHKDPFPDPNENNLYAKLIDKVVKLPFLAWLIVLLLILLLIYFIYETRRRKREQRRLAGNDQAKDYKTE